MRKTIGIVLTILLVLLFASCSPSGGRGGFVSDFGPEEFVSDGVSMWLSGSSSNNVSFKSSFASGSARAGENGTAIVTAEYSGYLYKNRFEITGDVIYELPVEGGVVQRYRVITDENVSIFDSSDDSERVFVISRAEDVLWYCLGIRLIC